LSQNPRAKNGTTLLLVEDDDDTREALAELLEEQGFEVRAARDGSVALQALNEVVGGGGRCDLVILDLMMPVMNGWDFRLKQKADPRLANIPVLVMSAGTTIAAVTDQLQAADYVTKPVDIRDLLQKIQRIAAAERRDE
jgi:CheY-like chemotaxis protein